MRVGDRVRHSVEGSAGVVEHLGYQADLPLLHVRLDEPDERGRAVIRIDMYEFWEVTE